MAYTNPVIISSTVSPGMTSRLCADYPSLDLVYMPVMIHIGKAAETFLSSPLYFVGTKTRYLNRFYTSFLKMLQKLQT